MNRLPTRLPRLLAACILLAAGPPRRGGGGHRPRPRAPATARPPPGAQTATCRGSTDYGGRRRGVADSGTAGGRTAIDVRLELDATPLPLIHTRYLMQEISSWRPNGIERVAVNDRYSVDGHILRQQWDVYHRAADGPHPFRVQAPRAGEFQRQHPGFMRFWNPDRFGQPWLGAYPYSIGARRPDLDLHQDPSLVRTPLALAFYWLRWLPPQGGVVPLFLPGFKEQKLVELAIGPVPGQQPGGTSGWKAPIEYPYLSPTRPSAAFAWTSSDRHVRQLVFDLHGVAHSARGAVHEEGCRDVPPG